MAARRENPSEDELVRRGAMGDRKAQELLVRRYEEVALRFAHRMLGSSDEARDAVQEAFYRALSHLPDLHGRFGPWFFRILSNVCTDQYRKRRRTALLPLNGSERANPDPDHTLRALVRQALQLLPERYRTVIALRDLEGFSTQETADLLGIREGAVRVLLFRARQRLATVIRELEEDQ